MVKVYYVDAICSVHNVSPDDPNALKELCRRLKISLSNVFLLDDSGNVYTNITSSADPLYLYLKSGPSNCLNFPSMQDYKTYTHYPIPFKYTTRFDFNKIEGAFQAPYDDIPVIENRLFLLYVKARENYAKYCVQTQYLNQVLMQMKILSDASQSIVQMALNYGNLQQNAHNNIQQFYQTLNFKAVQMQQSFYESLNRIDWKSLAWLDIDPEALSRSQNQFMGKISKIGNGIYELQGRLNNIIESIEEVDSSCMKIEDANSKFVNPYFRQELGDKEPEFAVGLAVCSSYEECRNNIEIVLSDEVSNTDKVNFANSILATRSEIPEFEQLYITGNDDTLQRLQPFLGPKLEEGIKRIRVFFNLKIRGIVVKAIQQLRFDVAQTIEKLRNKLENLEQNFCILEIPAKLQEALQAAEDERIRQNRSWQQIRDKFEHLRMMIVGDQIQRREFLERCGDILPYQDNETLLVQPHINLEVLRYIFPEMDKQHENFQRQQGSEIYDLVQNYELQIQGIYQQIDQQEANVKQQNEHLQQELDLITRKLASQKAENLALDNSLQHQIQEVNKLKGTREEVILKLQHHVEQVKLKEDAFLEAVGANILALKHENAHLKANRSNQ